MAAGEKYDMLIIGGGLAGLTCALHLSKNKCKVLNHFLIFSRKPSNFNRFLENYISMLFQ